MTTIAPERQGLEQQPIDPLCHIRVPGANPPRFYCGSHAGQRGGSDVHTLAECRARGHSLCVVCETMWGGSGR